MSDEVDQFLRGTQSEDPEPAPEQEPTTNKDKEKETRRARWAEQKAEAEAERERNRKQHKGQGQGQGRRKSRATAKGRRRANTVTISQAMRMHAGYVKVTGGMISGSRKLEKMLSQSFFTCANCGTYNESKKYKRPVFAYETGKATERPRKCKNCEENGFDYDYHVRNAIKIELQDIHTFSDLERLPAVLFDDCTNNVSVGEQVIVTGEIQKIRVGSSLMPFLFVSKVQYENRDSLNEATEAEIRKIKSIPKKARKLNKNIIEDELVPRFAPTVIGYEFVKKGILICAANSGQDAVNRRLRINALLIGETGLDKSPLLRAETNLVPKSRYCSALNSSIRSLVAIVDKEDDNIMLRLGPVTSSSGAICAIDEIGRMQHEDQGHLLSALQEGKIPFAKHGINTVLDGSATFIMSANPSTNDGKWRHEGSIERNEIPLLGPFLDTNDLIFIFRTNRNKHDIIKYAFEKADMNEDTYASEEENYDFLMDYISYSKRFNPILSHEARNMLIQYYANIATKTGSPRIFDTLRNIAFAIARLKQKKVIDVEDADETIQFYNVIAQQLQEVVIVAKDPRELAIEEIIRILSISKYNHDFIELVGTVCRSNEFVSRYIGNDFHIENNKKLRALRKRFIDGVDNRIIVFSLSPLVLGWKTTDSTDPTDQIDQQRNEKQSNNSGENISKAANNCSDSQVSQVSQVSINECDCCDFKTSSRFDYLCHLENSHRVK